MSGPGISGAWGAAAVALGAYLLGSISWSYLIVRAVRGEDVRTLGSGNAGATNALRAAGKGAGLAVLLLDAGKGAAAVVGARALGASPGVAGAAAVAVALGHVYPVFFGLRGGKGVATSAGAMAALAPLPLALALAVFAVALAWKRYVSLGSVAAGIAFPLLMLLCDRLGWERYAGGGGAAVLAAGAALGLLILHKHGANLSRVRAGTEPRLGERRAGAPEPETEAGGAR
jgi:acyl phosphate:glycerol-3-phosphate acyltransferase